MEEISVTQLRACGAQSIDVEFKIFMVLTADKAQ